MRLALILLVALPLCGWNETGHKTIAYVAYANLNKPVRIRVDALLQKHPDFAAWKGQPFLEASYWPDVIRGNPRYDHPNWHYINVFFSPDGTPTPASDYTGPSVLTKIGELRRTVGDTSLPEPERAIHLAWLLHLVADVHQPLHAASRCIRSLPQGDRGGNLTYVKGASNLHSYWDSLLGNTPTEQFLTELGGDLMKTAPREKPVNPNERDWVDQSHRLAQERVYTFGRAPTTKDQPALLPDTYQAAGRTVARARAALAGDRLADLLNEAFGATP